MADFRYFAGDKQLKGIRRIGNELFGYSDSSELYFVQGEGWKGYTKVERTIEFKSNPSRHECDARCMNATGKIMKCECSCGGKNHGRGNYVCEVA